MPAETAHHVGGTKHFECRVKGHPRPDIRWYKDGKEITHLSRYQFEQSQDGVISMVIPNITNEDEGHYRCRAENSEGFASTGAYLFVRGHKEHPEEATTSFHAMQIEEAVFFSEKEKAARKMSKVESSESHIEASVIEGINGDYLKDKRLFLEAEEVANMSVENEFKSSSTSAVTSSTTTSSVTKKPGKEVAEQESTKINADMLEKSYNSHDEASDDVDSVRLRTISERSETSMKESPSDSFNDDRSSLLMRQTKRLFSHDYTDENDLFQIEASTMLETSATRTKITSVSTSENVFAKTGTAITEVSTTNVKSAAGETKLEATKSRKTDTVTSSATNVATPAENGEMVITQSTTSSLSQTRLETSAATKVESSTSLMSVTQVAEEVEVTVEESVSGSKSSRSLAAEAKISASESPDAFGEVNSRMFKKRESEVISSSFPEDDSGFLESSSSKTDSSLLLTFESDVSVTSNQDQPEPAGSFLSDTQVKETSTRLADDGENDSSKGNEDKSSRLSSEELQKLDVDVGIESKKGKLLGKDEEDNESISESETGSSVGSVVGVDVDFDNIQTQKLQKQESKEKDETEEEAKLAALAASNRKTASVKEEVEIHDNIRGEAEDIKHDDMLDKNYHDSRRKSETDDKISVKKKEAYFVDSSKNKVDVVQVEVDEKEGDFVDSSKATVDKVQVEVDDKKKSDDKKDTEIDVDEEIQTPDDKITDVRKKVEVDDSTIVADKEMKDKHDKEITDHHGDQSRHRHHDSVDTARKDKTENEVSLNVFRLLQEDEIDSEETVEQTVSWIEKVEEEKDKNKTDIKEIDDATAKEDESPQSEPKIVQKMENTRVEAGKTLKLRTQVQAHPRPDVMWSKDGQVLMEGGRITIVTEDDVYSLEIVEMNERDAGTYRLTAVNSRGETFTDVVVSVTASPSTLQPGDREMSLTATVGIPQFLVQPQDVSVAEFDMIHLTCSVRGEPAPKVSWEKDGQLVRSNRRVRVYESRDVYNLEIYDCEAEDAGEYVCTAANSHGQITASVHVTIEGAASVLSVSGPAELEGDMAEPVEDTLVGATGGGTESSSDELFLKPYITLMDYTDPDTKTSFKGGELVEILDSRQKSGMWLVRGKVEKDKVCFVPSNMLCIAGDASVEGNKKEDDTDEEVISQKKRERKTNHSPKLGSAEVDNDTSEDEFRLREVHPDYVAIADYLPPAGDTSSLRLSEGQIVEVIDMERPDFWLVKTRPTKTSPSRQGWVPSAYLEEKNVSAQFMHRSAREKFRDEVLQVSNKQQEASLKRRPLDLTAAEENPFVYVLKEMEETEREYIADLKKLVETYVNHITAHPDAAPENITANADVIFSNVADILKFHDSLFLADIADCCARPSAIGAVFLKWQCEFDNYIRFWGDRDAANFLLEADDIKTFFKEFSRKLSAPENTVTNLLKKPVDRLKMYQLLLKDVLRYAARAGEDCSQVEAAIAMLIAIEKNVANNKLLPLLEGFEGDVTDLGNLFRHDDFIVWEGDVSSSRVKDRHVFLFADKIVMTKKKKPELSTDPTCFSYKACVDLSTVRVRETAGDDDRRFELWFLGDSAVEKITLQARSGSAKQAWIKDIREALVKLGVSEPDKMPDVISEQQEEEDLTPAASPLSSPLLSPKTSQGAEFGFDSEIKPGDVNEEILESVKPDVVLRDQDVSCLLTEEDDQKKPFIRHLMKNVVCHEGNLARVECSVGGNPSPSVTWQKGDKLIQEGEGIQISSQGETSCLIFSEVNRSNSGTYTVTVSNSFGSSSSSFDLVVVEDFAETDTSTDRTNGEVGDTESGSETVVEEEGEAVVLAKKDTTRKRELVEEEVVDKKVIKEKEEEAKEAEAKQVEYFRQEVQEEEFTSSKRVHVRTLAEEEVGLFGKEVGLKGAEEETDQLVEGVQQADAVKQVLFSQSETKTTRSHLHQEEEGEDWTLGVSSEVTETSSHKAESELLIFNSEAFTDSSAFVRTEASHSSLSFETEVSNSESVDLITGDKEPRTSHSEELSLQAEASVDSSSFNKADVSQNLLTFESDVSNSESVEAVHKLISPRDTEPETLKSEDLSLQSEASVDSSAFRKADVSQNLLTFETDISNSESVDVITLQPESRLPDTLSEKSETSTDSFTYSKADISKNLLSFDTEVSNSTSVETVHNLTTPEENVALKTELKSQAEEEGRKAEVDQVKEAEILEEEAVAENRQASEVEDKRRRRKLKEVEEVIVVKTEDTPEEETSVFEKNLPEEQTDTAEDLLAEETIVPKAQVQQTSATDSEATFGQDSKPSEDTQAQVVLQEYLPSAETRDQENSVTETEITFSEAPVSVTEQPQDYKVETLEASKASDKLEEPSAKLVTSKTSEESTAKPLQADTLVQESKPENLPVDRSNESSKETLFAKFESDNSAQTGEQTSHGKVDIVCTEESQPPKNTAKVLDSVSETLSPQGRATDLEDTAATARTGLLKSSSEAEVKQKLESQADANVNQLSQPLEAAAKVRDSKVENLPATKVKDSAEKTAESVYAETDKTSEEPKSRQEALFASVSEKQKEEEYKKDFADGKGRDSEKEQILTDTQLQEETTGKYLSTKVEEDREKREEVKRKEESFGNQEEKRAELEGEILLQREESKSERPEQEKTFVEKKREENKKEEDSHQPLAPRFEEKMDDCVIELGDLARFDCRVSAYPDPEITWYKDGNKVTPSTKHELLNFHDDIFSLLIKKVDQSDSGRYTCVAKNEYGEAKSQALLNVMGLKEKITDAHVAPSFVTKFYDIEAVEGVPVEFVCMIDGNPEPTVAWFLNGKEVESSSEILCRRQEDTVMLAFRSIKVEHSGEIICKLKNDSGQAMCKARLKVKEDVSKRGQRPLFLEQPSDKEITEGDEVTFECVISGLPEPEVTWYFNGRELHESRRRTMRHKPGQKYTLTLKEVIPENAGVYTCKAVNCAGDASCAVELSVKEMPTDQLLKGKFYDANQAFDSAKYAFPPSFTRRIQDQRSLPGRMARFEALVIGIPEPEVEWQKDGFPIKWGPKYKMGREGNTTILVVENCDMVDEGTYTCNLYNDAGKASCSAQLRVQEEKPYQPHPRYMSPARGVDLFRASPSPAPRKSVVREIPLEDKIPTIPFDKPVLLDVKANATKLSWMPAPTARLPENAQKITYTIEARQLPSNQWIRLDSNIEATTHYVYGLRPDTEYMFRVRAENRFGTSEPTLPCTLRPREEPKRRESALRESETPVRPVLPKARPYVSDIGKETIQIGWKPAEIPDYIGRSTSLPPVTYRVEAQKLPSEEWVPLASRVKKPSIYLSDLESDRDYNIRIRAQTPYGVSQPTEPVWIPRAKAFTGVPVSRPIITEIEEGTARLQWNRVDIPAFNSSDEPLLYMIEMQEPPSSRWREVARRVPTNYYIVRDLEPAQDYRFRVRAESRDGLLSEPSPATSMFRTFALSRAPVDRLEVEEYDPDLQSARLSWRRVEVPSYGAEDTPLLYMIECETPGQDGWRPLVSGIPTTRYRVPDISPTEDYRFRVRALSQYGVSPPSYPTGLYRRPSPMRPLAQDLHISSLEPEGLRLSWRSASVPPVRSAEPVSYQIEGLEYPKQEWRPLATNIRDTSYRLGGLKPSSDYSFRVRAQTPSGLAEPTPPVTLTSMPVRPRLPVREPIISELSRDSVRLQWKPAELPYYSRHTTPITYTVDYQEIPGRDWVVAARNIPDTSYTVRGLRGDHDYRFRICPETEYGPGEYSLPVHVHRRTAPKLPTREPLLSNVSPVSATLSWPSATLASGSPSRPITYRVEGREPPSSTWYEVAGRVPSTSYNLQFLYPDQDYMFRVYADYDGIESEPTLAVYLPRRAGPPKMFRDAPFVSNVQPESVILSWRSVELPSRITDYSPVNYRIEVQEGPNSEWRPLERQVNQTHFHVTRLRPDLDYSFRIRAENEFGISDPTDPILVRKRAVAPIMSQHEPLISDVRADSLRLTWQPAEMPSYLTDSVPVTYTILMQEDGDHAWQPLARRVAGTNYYVTGLAPDRDYSFRIQAENNFGSSLPSFPSRLHRKLKAPIYSPEIEDVDSTSFRLSWKQPALSKPTTYSVETLEPLTWKWRPLVSRLPHPSYRVTGIQPTKDYAFRVRAEVDSVISDPSLPISFSRRRVGGRAMSEQPASKQALPTVPVERPTLSEVYEDSVRINWHPTYYHGSARKHLPQAYRLEVREQPDTNWHTLVPRTDARSYEVTDLKPNQDYAFRVRTVTDTGMSEPSLPVFLYRQSATPKFPLPSPEISDVGDDYINLKWQLVDIPAFDMDETPLSFMIEAQRVPDYDWRPVARGITSTSHKVTGLEPSHDYKFRLRGETYVGLTQPSATIPVYRKPVKTGVPITNLRVDTDSSQPYSARLRWNPVYAPPYGASMNYTYTVEVQEPPRTDWYPLARDISATSYSASELSPLKDYLFRVKARPPGGDYSIPTPPVPYYRSPLSSWDRVLPPVTPIIEDYAPIARPYIEGLILKVPPRMSIEKPDMIVISPECVSLSWKAARVPSATSSLSPTTYRVEVRHEDSFEWIEKATGIKGLNTEIRGLNPYIDYAFRVRAVNDFGWSESTLPAFLHRPQELRDAADAMEFEQPNIYGSHFSDISVPRMPMDTPRMGLVQDGRMNLSWTPARIPAYARKTPITYVVEKKEPADYDWVPLVSRLQDTTYNIKNIESKQDYLFRIRAENEHGISEATLPAALTRSRTPQFIRSSASRERELDSPSRRLSYSYIDSISSGVPPRVPAGRPSLSDITDTSLTLSWQPGRMPSYIKGPVKIGYIVEARQPPNHMWTKISESVTSTSYRMTDLRPDKDYMFRVRAYNDSGMSEPTLPVTFTRERASATEPRTLRKRSSVERFSSMERRASQERSLSMDRGSSVPSLLSRDSSRREDEDIYVGKTPDNISAAPEFAPAGSPGVQYAIDAQPVKISLQLRGNPQPTVDWYFNGKKLMYGDKYDGYVTPAGLAVLEFSPVTWDDVGDYRCVAENDQGQATFVVKLQMSDPPTFLEPIKDLQLKPQLSGRFTCRVDGIPFPTVKFLKDWKPVAETSRFKVTQDGVDQWSLNIEQAGPSLAGCYVCVAENAAGKVFSMARLSVDDDIPAESVYYKKTNFEDDYYVLEELGRGRYSTLRRVLERSTGKEYAAKFTKVRDEADKDFFRLELDALIRQKSPHTVKLHDAYESPQQLILILHLVKAGDLLDRVTVDNNWTESRAAKLIKLIVLALRDVHSSGFVHLDLKPTNIRFSSAEDSSLQLIDFGFSRKLPISSDLIFNYGTPEFCSPEAISSEAVTSASDLWAVGVLSHLLLTGISPFHAETVPETLSQVRDCKWSADDSHFSSLSPSAKDFISRLLVRQPQDRLSLDACLSHDWLKVAEKTDLPRLDVSRLKAFHERTKVEEKASAVKTVARLVSLKRLLEGPITIRGLQPTTDPQTGEVILPDTEDYGQFLDEESWYDWQTRHQQVAPSRVQAKGYKKLAGSVDSLTADGEDDLGSQDRDRIRSQKLAGTDRADIPPSLEKELEWLEESRKERRSRDIDEISLASKRSSVASISTEGFPGSLFKEKLHDLAFGEGDTVILRCVIVGPPAPTVVWYKNEELLAEGTRLKMTLEEDGEATLTIKNAKNYDAGIYKCVGRNKFGRVSNRMRLLLGDVPGRPGQPAVAQVSSTDALILWEAPKSDGNSTILFYKLDYKSSGQDRWLTATYTTQEAAVVTALKPSTFYRFRVSATNRFGTSQYSWASVETSTKPEGSAPITADTFFDVAKLKSIQTSTRPTLPTEKDDIIPEDEASKLQHELKLNSSPVDSVYNIGNVLYKGKYYEEKSLTLPSDNDKKFILRTVPAKLGLGEFEILKSLRHERLVRLFTAFSTVDYIYLVLEYTEGDHVARHLSCRRKYTENTVASIIRQVLYALEYLQRSCIVHLNLQPASIVVSKVEGCEVKLTDFSLARKVSGPDGEVAARRGFVDFIPPEVVVKDLAGFPADIWGVGTLAFLLLSGVSPFHGDSYESTLVNIALNRYEAVDLYENITIEALKFLFKVLKRVPRNRPSLQDCLDHKWLQLTEQAIKEREDTIFLTNTLASFVDEYDTVRQSEHFRQSFEDDQLPVQMSADGRDGDRQV